MTEASSFVCYDSARPTCSETFGVLSDVSQIWVVGCRERERERVSPLASHSLHSTKCSSIYIWYRHPVKRTWYSCETVYFSTYLGSSHCLPSLSLSPDVILTAPCIERVTPPWHWNWCLFRQHRENNKNEKTWEKITWKACCICPFKVSHQSDPQQSECGAWTGYNLISGWLGSWCIQRCVPNKHYCRVTRANKPHIMASDDQTLCVSPWAGPAHQTDYQHKCKCSLLDTHEKCDTNDPTQMT